MNYYLVFSNQASFDSFRKRIAALANAHIIENTEELHKILAGNLPGNAFFFIHYLGLDEKIDEQVMLIKEKAPHGKIIYITKENDAHELKNHQMGPVGGDAYINPEISEKQFNRIMEGLKSPDIVMPKNRLESQVGAQFGEVSELERFKNHPLNRQINELFASVIQEPKKAKWQSLNTLSPAESEEIEEGEFVGTKDEELTLDDNGELELSLSEDNDDAQEVHLDDSLELSLDSDEGLDLGDLGMTENPEASSEEEISLSDNDISLGEDDGLSLNMEEEGLSLGDDDGLSLNMEEEGLSLGEDDGLSLNMEEEGLSLGDDVGLSLDTNEEELSLGNETGDALSLNTDGNDEALEDLGGLSFDNSPGDDGLSLELGSEDIGELLIDGSESFEENGLEFSGDDSLGLNLSDDLSKDSAEPSLSFEDDDSLSLSGELDLSEDAKEKLKEIDAILDYDASQVLMRNDLLSQENLDEPLVSETLDLGNINFDQTDTTNLESTGEIEATSVVAPQEGKPKKKKKEVAPVERHQEYGEDLKELSSAYSGEMERMQATISNLRSDRGELLAKIQTLEEEKLLHNRQTLSLRAELDERKIELTIIRKKLNEEINELKDRVKLFDEKRLILEEKNRVLAQELDKAGQKNKIDLRKIQGRERELEQKLELLKSDAETQIRNRDIKILELKRKIDGMEFDMESISLQEKRSVESRFELEDKLEKAIKTLRSAITVLEDETDRTNALDALKKNIDM